MVTEFTKVSISSEVFSYICSMLMLVTKTTFDFLIFSFSKGTVFFIYLLGSLFAYQGYPLSLVAVVMRMRRKLYFLLTFPVLL
jgi:hypothetical protein